jgi:hypothetical protein
LGEFGLGRLASHRAQKENNLARFGKKKVSLVSLFPPIAQEVVESLPMHSGERLEETHETHKKRVSH